MSGTHLKHAAEVGILRGVGGMHPPDGHQRQHEHGAQAD